MTGYELSRKWFDFSFENPEKIKPIHTAIYFFAIEHCNRLGWKQKFGFPSSFAMETLGIKSYNTYINALNDLVNFGFVEMIEKSKNQYTSNIIALSNFNIALDKALDKALIKHEQKQHESIDSIDKQITINKEQDNNKELSTSETIILKNEENFEFKKPSPEQKEKTDFFETEIKPFFDVPESATTYNRIYLDLMKDINGNFEYFKQQFFDYKAFQIESKQFKKSIKTFLSEWNGTDWKKAIKGIKIQSKNDYPDCPHQKRKIVNGIEIFRYINVEGKKTINKNF